MSRGRWNACRTALFLGGLTVISAQVIEFESGGLKYLTQTKNGVTVMFAQLPLPIREYAVVQVAISNGSAISWNFRPEDFRFLPEEGGTAQGAPAAKVVGEFLNRGGRDDVIKLVTAYENGLYGMVRVRSTNGYESRRQAAMAELTSARIKAAAAASAIVLAPVKLKPGESTDGAVFFANGGKSLGSGRLLVQVAGNSFEFTTVATAPRKP
jgi:hypothetical protein